MKKIIFLVSLCWAVLGFSQNNQSTAVVKHNVDIGQSYEFEHGVNYFPELEHRLFNYANRNEQVILELNIAEGKCVVLFREDISPVVLNETLLFLAQGLSFSDFYISTDN